MSQLEDEKRRYFRIEDTIGVKFERITEVQALKRQEEMRRPGYYSANRIQVVERELQLLIDKMRIQQPDFAKAMELLNTKISILRDDFISDPLQEARYGYIKTVSLSACGVSFEHDNKIAEGEKMDMDLTLLPTDLHLYTLGEVVGCDESEEELGTWMLRVDFYGMSANDEELLVQHIVKRQGQLRANERKTRDMR
ncbi:MAG: PilZ domain-containing protein [Pseudomonadales bacterium]|nr:PilZ domain-containing protein [Pseudomonadales bacterium]